MNKRNLINAIAAKAAITKVEAKKMVESIVKTIEGAVKKGDKVALTSFGAFSVVDKKARKGVDPITKKYIDIPAHKAVKFKPGKTLAGIVK
jgi:DNA-binding protein HU-beta